MASSRKPTPVEGRRARPARLDDALAGADRFLRACGDLRGLRIAAAVSGGVDSVVLLHLLRTLAPQHGFVLSAVHVHHGLSRNADDWARFVARLCRSWKLPLVTRRVKVERRGRGLEAAARAARQAVFARLKVDAIALGHQLDDQAETVLLNLLRGAGVRGAGGMSAVLELHAARGPQRLLRPLLGLKRESICDYARAQGLRWIEDESNRDAALTRNFLRLHVGPLLATRFAMWRESLARAAGHFAAAERLLHADSRNAGRLGLGELRALDPAAARLRLRAFLRAHGLRPPGAKQTGEILRQLLTARGSGVALAHEGRLLRVYRDELVLARPAGGRFEPLAWSGERRLAIAALGGELRFRRVRGDGIDARRVALDACTVRLRSGGERMQLHAQRPRRTLKNLFQEAGVPSWERERLPLLFLGDALAWAPGLGVDVSLRAAAREAGWLPEWRPQAPKPAPQHPECT